MLLNSEEIGHTVYREIPPADAGRMANIEDPDQTAPCQSNGDLNLIVWLLRAIVAKYSPDVEPLSIIIISHFVAFLNITSGNIVNFYENYTSIYKDE